MYDGDVPVAAVHCLGAPAGVGWWTPGPGDAPATVDDAPVAAAPSVAAADESGGGGGDGGDGGGSGGGMNAGTGQGSGALLATVEGAEVAPYDLRAGVSAVTRRRPGPGALHALHAGGGGLVAAAGADRTLRSMTAA